MLVLGTLLPGAAKAGSLNEALAGFFNAMAHPQKLAPVLSYENLQTLPLPRAAMNIDPNPTKGGGDIVTVDNSALLPDEVPSGTGADIAERPKNDQISIYVVRDGDTLSSIGKLFGVSANTILWANDMSKASNLRVGQTLTILPVTGIQYTAKKGDTLASVAKKYHGDAGEIASFNGIDGDLAVGDQIIIPDGEVTVIASAGSGFTSGAPKGSLWKKVVDPNATVAEYAGYYLRPLVGGVKTQGIHGYNGIDLGAPVGSPILASASGDVIVARDSGWNGGYGQYVVIRHDNGTQTLYGHASQVIVGVGEHVVRGQVIAYVGRTGRATGPHLHFEIRGGPRNPF